MPTRHTLYCIDDPAVANNKSAKVRQQTADEDQLVSKFGLVLPEQLSEECPTRLVASTS